MRVIIMNFECAIATSVFIECFAAFYELLKVNFVRAPKTATSIIDGIGMDFSAALNQREIDLKLIDSLTATRHTHSSTKRHPKGSIKYFNNLFAINRNEHKRSMSRRVESALPPFTRRQ